MKLITAGLIALLALPAAAHAAPAAKFLRDAIQGDNSEMTLGALAQKRGSSAGIRSFGATLYRDHSQAKVDAVAAARREHAAVPSGMMPEARTEYAKLQHLSGRAFDTEFARYMVEDHQKDIREFEQQAKTGDRTTAALARATLPHLRHHLQLATRLR
jgi:putative membrane protein